MPLLMISPNIKFATLLLFVIAGVILETVAHSPESAKLFYGAAIGMAIPVAEKEKRGDR